VRKERLRGLSGGDAAGEDDSDAAGEASLLPEAGCAAKGGLGGSGVKSSGVKSSGAGRAIGRVFFFSFTQGETRALKLGRPESKAVI
jgi:hypothetical protein